MYGMIEMIMVITIIISVVAAVAAYVLMAVFYMKLFAKANVPAWKAWVPVVNVWKFLELGGYHGAISLLAFVGMALSYCFLGIFFYSMLNIDYYSLVNMDYIYQLNDNPTSLQYGDLNTLITGFSPFGALGMGGFFFAYILQMVASLISLICTVFMCMSAYQIGLKLGKEGTWVILYIFLAPVWMGIMAFNKAVWNDSLAKVARGTERPPTWTPSSAGFTAEGGYPAYGAAPAGTYSQAGAYPPQGVGAYPAGGAGAYSPGGTGAYPPQVASMQPSPVGQQTMPGQVYLQPQKQPTNGLGVASLICGIVGLCTFLPSIAAVILGAIGMRKPYGKGLAIAGLIIGIFGVLIWALFIIVSVMMVTTMGSM